VTLPAPVSAPDGPDDHLDRKEQRLRGILDSLGSVVVAFSGGVDSAYLAVVATSALGDRALCVTADSPSYPSRHRDLALRIATEFRLRHEFLQTAEMERPEYVANPSNRCYYCKQELFTKLTALARDRGVAAIVDGNNADDRGDYRPGREAAREFAVRSPLDEAGLTKADVRELSRRRGLPTWDQPASACLSSRIPYDSEVTVEKLRMIEQAEDVLHGLGFRHCRVRHHGDVARIELAPEDMARALDAEVRAALVRDLKAIGYRYVSLDLEGYRMGSLNEGLRLRPV
jgi:pyridinium-3,5-biscarboxylic acid mononucleotide sulfurtransferase